jgi:hypothetical protein
VLNQGIEWSLGYSTEIRILMRQIGIGGSGKGKANYTVARGWYDHRNELQQSIMWFSINGKRDHPKPTGTNCPLFHYNGIFILLTCKIGCSHHASDAVTHVIPYIRTERGIKLILGENPDLFLEFPAFFPL